MTVCDLSLETLLFMRHTQKSPTCVIPTKTHLLLGPVIVLYEFEFKEGEVDAGIG